MFNWIVTCRLCHRTRRTTLRFPVVNQSVKWQIEHFGSKQVLKKSNTRKRTLPSGVQLLPNQISGFFLPVEMCDSVQIRCTGSLAAHVEEEASWWTAASEGRHAVRDGSQIWPMACHVSGLVHVLHEFFNSVDGWSPCVEVERQRILTFGIVLLSFHPESLQQTPWISKKNMINANKIF